VRSRKEGRFIDARGKKMKGEFKVNGKQIECEFDGGESLLQVLRANGFTEVKSGCNDGECGSCVVILDGKLVNSCQVFAASAVGRDIITVKGIGDIHNPHPIQKAFVDSGGVQCGFCTPGKVLAAYCLLKKNPNPTEDEIKDALNGILCRCTGYVKIIEAVRDAVKRAKDGA
jgi:carbon-monoxide dehydrogenase small subunit